MRGFLFPSQIQSNVYPIFFTSLKRTITESNCKYTEFKIISKEFVISYGFIGYLYLHHLEQKVVASEDENQ